MPRAKILNMSLNPALRDTRHALLRKEGYEVMSASTWIEFEEACGAHQFDLVLLGQTLPPSLKHDIEEFALKHCPSCKIAELYLFAPSLPAKYIFHMHSNYDPKDFLKFVAEVLASSPPI